MFYTGNLPSTRENFEILKIKDVVGCGYILLALKQILTCGQLILSWFEKVLNTKSFFTYLYAY